MASLFCFYVFSPNYKYQVNKKRKEKKTPEIQYFKKEKKMEKILDKSKKYLNQYITVTDIILAKIRRHAKRYQISEEICA